MKDYSIELFYFKTSHAYFLILDPNYLILIFLILDLITSHMTSKITYFLFIINLELDLNTFRTLTLIPVE